MIPAWTVLIALVIPFIGISWDTFLILKIKRDLHDIARREVGKAAGEVAGEFEKQLRDNVLVPISALLARFGVANESAKHNDSTDNPNQRTPTTTR